MTDLERDKIIITIKKEIERVYSASSYWGTNEVIHANPSTAENVKIYAGMIKGREYLAKERPDGNIDFYKNPNYERERLDLINAKRVSKTYWCLLGVAVLGFLISFYLLILRLKGE